MKEINEKDLEQASGGVHPHTTACGNFVARDPVMEMFTERECMSCKYFKTLSMSSGECTFNKGELA